MKLRLLYLALTVVLWAVLVAGSSGLVLDHFLGPIDPEVELLPECLQEEEAEEAILYTNSDPRDVPNWSGRVSFYKEKQEFVFYPALGYRPEPELVPATEIISGLWIGSTYLDHLKIWYDERRDSMRISYIDLGRCYVGVDLDRLENGVFMARKPVLMCDE